jgi:predicted KAP-like P-loop ATPase
MADDRIHNDEPAVQDRLNRADFARALADLVPVCETPLVIGLYGGWGTGKTSLMRLIDQSLDPKRTASVWFDAWQHQHDEDAAVALLHTIVHRFELGQEGRKLLSVISLALGSAFLKSTTNLSIEDIDTLGQRYEEQLFQVREARIRLAEHFSNVIERARGYEDRRIVFFIDDLDSWGRSRYARGGNQNAIPRSFRSGVELPGQDRAAAIHNSTYFRRFVGRFH